MVIVSIFDITLLSGNHLYAFLSLLLKFLGARIMSFITLFLANTLSRNISGNQ